MSSQGPLQKIFQSLFSGKQNRETTELELLRSRISELEQKLEEKDLSVERAKSTFLKNLYHEIRTPLNGIIGFSDLIEMNSITGKDRNEYIKYIRESSREFLRKMDNIIEASIIEAGLLKIQKEQCQLYELMNEVHAYFSLHKHIIEKKIAFLMTVPQSLHKVEVICDVFRITQVISHLISNAFKYTPQGVVEFGCDIVDNDLQFFVKDTGVGGLEGREDEVFKNFSKMDDEPNEENTGLGLGLGLSKNIIEQMDGKIWYESSLGQGTTFYFTIPYHPVYVTKKKKVSAIKKALIPLTRTYKRSVSI